MNTPIGTTIIVASRRLCLIVIFLFTCFGQKLFAQEGLSSITIKETKAHKFRKTVPPGNYSGLTRLGGEHYAVVDDKSKSDGFWLFTIKIDSITGEILNVKADTFISSAKSGRRRYCFCPFQKHFVHLRRSPIRDKRILSGWAYYWTRSPFA